MECLLSLQRMGCEGAYVEEEDVRCTQRVPALLVVSQTQAIATSPLFKIKLNKEKESENICLVRCRIKKYNVRKKINIKRKK